MRKTALSLLTTAAMLPTSSSRLVADTNPSTIATKRMSMLDTAVPIPIVDQKRLTVVVDDNLRRQDSTDIRYGVTDADRSCVAATSPIRSAKIGRFVGRGASKSVFELCQDSCSNIKSEQKCQSNVPACTPSATTVVQVIPFDRNRPNDGKELTTIRSERAVLQRLAGIDAADAKNRTAVYVPLLAYAECAATRKSFVVQPRLGETMQDVGKRQAADVLSGLTPVVRALLQQLTILVLTPAQLSSAFRSLQQLQQRYGIIHGDAKPDNIYLNGDTAVYGDFGQSGLLDPASESKTTAIQPARGGFAEFNYGCGPVPTDPRLRSFYNIWQLELALRSGALVLMPVAEGLDGVASLLPFGSVDQLGQNGLSLPADVRRQLDARCGTLSGRMNDRNNRIQELRQVISRASADEIYRRVDPSLPAATNATEMTHTALRTLLSNPDSYLESPTWQRSLVRAGLAPELARSQLLRLPTSKPSAVVRML